MKKAYYVLLTLALLTSALILIIPALQRMAHLLSFPYAHDGLEGTLLYEARLLRSGQALYQPLERYRFLSAPYPPVSYLFFALFDLIQGAHVFWSARLVSGIAALGIAFLSTMIVRKTGSSWAIAIFAAALLLSVPPLQLWGTRIKPDVLALLFTCSGLFFGMHSLIQTAPSSQYIPNTTRTTSALGSQLSANGHPWFLGLAALAFTLAFYTKQTAVAGPLALGIALLAADWRDWRPDIVHRLYVWKFPFQWRTLAFAFSYLVLTLGSWLILDLITDGQYSLHVWWSGDRSQWWSFGLFRKIVELLGFWWPQMLLALLILPFSISRRALFVPACYALVAPLTLLGAGETGAHHNHLLETHLALTLAGCSALGVALGLPVQKQHEPLAQKPNNIHNSLGVFVALVALALTGVQVIQALQPPDWYTGELAANETPERYLEFMRATPGEILADDTGLLFQAGRDLRYDDPSTMGPAATIGKWDQSGLIEEITQQKFSTIMIPVNLERSDIDASGRWTAEMLAAIKAHYRLKFRDTIYVYVPR